MPSTRRFASGPRGAERRPEGPRSPGRSGARGWSLRAPPRSCGGLGGPEPGPQPLTLRGGLGAGPQPGLQGQVQQEDGGSARGRHVGAPRSPRVRGRLGSGGPAGRAGGARPRGGLPAGGAAETSAAASGRAAVGGRARVLAPRSWVRWRQGRALYGPAGRGGEARGRGGPLARSPFGREAWGWPERRREGVSEGTGDERGPPPGSVLGRWAWSPAPAGRGR